MARRRRVGRRCHYLHRGGRPAILPVVSVVRPQPLILGISGCDGEVPSRGAWPKRRSYLVELTEALQFGGENSSDCAAIGWSRKTIPFMVDTLFRKREADRKGRAETYSSATLLRPSRSRWLLPVGPHYNSHAPCQRPAARIRPMHALSSPSRSASSPRYRYTARSSPPESWMLITRQDAGFLPGTTARTIPTQPGGHVGPSLRAITCRPTGRPMLAAQFGLRSGFIWLAPDVASRAGSKTAPGCGHTRRGAGRRTSHSVDHPDDGPVRAIVTS